MRKIPTAFTLGAHRFRVKYVSEDEMNRLSEDEGCYGLTHPDELIIYLREPSKTLKRSIIVETFWHEFGHCLLWTLGHKDWRREQVVTPLGHALKQFNDTAEF